MPDPKDDTLPRTPPTTPLPYTPQPHLNTNSPTPPTSTGPSQPPASTGSSQPRSFASASLPRHLARGVLGFGALIASVALIPSIGPISLLLAPLGVLAFRGCPTCWAIGLVQTISMGRLQRECVDGRCELVASPNRGNQVRTG